MPNTGAVGDRPSLQFIEIDALDWETVAAAAAEYLPIGLLIGLRADLETLHWAGRTRSELADVHNLGSAARVTSTIVVTAGTAAATAVLTGSLQPFIAQLVPPTQPSTPPSSASAASSTR